MKKNVILICSLIISSLAYSQVGINTPNPQGTLHVDGAKDNPETGTPDPTQQSNDFTVTSNGDVGVGTTTPTNKLEVNSGTPNASGLKLTNLTSATPISGGATLGVDAAGNVVTVTGSAFTITSETIVAPATTTIPVGQTATLLNFTLPSAGTYLIIYNTRGQIQGEPSGLTSFLTTQAGTLIPNTEVLVTASGVNAVGNGRNGGTGTGTFIVTVTAPTTYSLRVKATGSAVVSGNVFNDTNGRTSVTFTKIAP